MGVIGRSSIADRHAKDLIMKLLAIAPKSRLSLRDIRQHPYFTSVGEGHTTKMFNSVVVAYEGLHTFVDDMQEKTDAVIELQNGYGGKKIPIRSEEGLQELNDEIEKELQLQADLS